jgi:Kef-type K+ transport system membrane component KefB
MATGPEIILFYIALIVIAGKIGGELAERLKQPAVLGELIIGIIIGPSVLGLIPSFTLLNDADAAANGDDLGQDMDEQVEAGNQTTDGNDADNATAAAEQDLRFTTSQAAPDGGGGFLADNLETIMNLGILEALATIGVLVLLFEVGLESNIKDFTKVGPSALLVAILGIVVSFAIGYAFSWWFATQFDWVVTPLAEADPTHLHLFIGATLTATSVGITARVLGDMGKIRSKESQVILGAAVLDDILALIILAVVGALVAGSGLTPLDVAKIFGIAVGFFVGSVAVGVLILPKALEWVTRKFRSHGIPLAFAFTLLIMMSYLATVSGLASIVGAFAGGLVLSQSPHKHVIFDQLKPIGTIFISFFFVTLGARVDLTSIHGENIVMVAIIGLALTLAGILGKLACAFGVVQKGVHRLSVGVGMVPRGEVGLIFALIGLELALLDNAQYATVIIVVMLTTLVTPIWLKRLKDKIGSEPGGGMPSLARTGELVEP